MHTEFDPSLPQIVADAEKLKQVFMNLLMNAKQAISGKGEIVVRTSKESSGDRVRVSVTDTRCGITSDLIDKIFDPFFTTNQWEKYRIGTLRQLWYHQDHSGRIEVEITRGKEQIRCHASGTRRLIARHYETGFLENEGIDQTEIVDS